MRARDLGIVIGSGAPGALNAITDVAGVRVGHTTLIEGDGPLVVGRGPVRTGVTVVIPHEGDVWADPVFAGCHTLNGNGELTGLEWVRESGFLGSPVGITNTHSVGVVRDALVADAVGRHRRDSPSWALPVVGETYDGALNDINGFHVRPEHVAAALGGASSGPVREGAVGGGTGMVCFEFKGGIGTASRVLTQAVGGWTVGVLVQANFGRRERLRVDGVPVGRELPVTKVPSPYRRAERPAAGSTAPGAGSIITVIATDAPLLPHQCRRLAERAGLGIAQLGGTGAHTSGDLFLCFATGNRGLSGMSAMDGPPTLDLRLVTDRVYDPLFEAVIEATEEAVLNAMVAANTVTGRDGNTAHALPHDLLLEALRRYGRPPAS